MGGLLTSSVVAAGGCGGEGSVDVGAPHSAVLDAGRHTGVDASVRERDAARADGESDDVERTRDAIIDSRAEDVEGGFLPGRPEVICAESAAVPVAPEASTFITDATVQSADSLDVPSNGDLWPSCWSGDALYAAWGDGFGFSEAGAYSRPSIGVARVLGDPSEPDAMSGETLAHDDDTQAIFKVWTAGPYYQKPTGMLCLNGQTFLAVQDLNASNYGDARRRRLPCRPTPARRGRRTRLRPCSTIMNSRLSCFWTMAKMPRGPKTRRSTSTGSTTIGGGRFRRPHRKVSISRVSQARTLSSTGALGSTSGAPIPRVFLYGPPTSPSVCPSSWTAPAAM